MYGYDYFPFFDMPYGLGWVFMIQSMSGPANCAIVMHTWRGRTRRVPAAALGPENR